MEGFDPVIVGKDSAFLFCNEGFDPPTDPLIDPLIALRRIVPLHRLAANQDSAAAKP